MSPVSGRRRLRIGIVSTEFIGPTRGGGIATFFSTLAERLAEAGHDVTLLYVLGQRCEAESIEHWIESYRRRGIRFVPMPVCDVPSEQPQYVLRSYDAYRWLRDAGLDVVHFADAQGCGYYSAAAKHQGFAFRDTWINVSGVPTRRWRPKPTSRSVRLSLTARSAIWGRASGGY